MNQNLQQSIYEFADSLTKLSFYYFTEWWDYLVKQRYTDTDPHTRTFQIRNELKHLPKWLMFMPNKNEKPHIYYKTSIVKMELFHKQKIYLNPNWSSILFKYIVHYLEGSIGDLKAKVETTFITLKKTLISRICLVSRTSDEKKHLYPRILRFWIDTWVSNDWRIFTTNLPCPCGAADTECGRWVGQSLFNCDQIAVHRKVFPEFAV